MKVLIFSGTSDGRRLSYDLSEMGHCVTVSVASATGKAFEEQEHPEIMTIYGRKTAAEMAVLIRGFDLVIDATHPYAAEVSREIRSAAGEAGKQLLRLKRPASVAPFGTVKVKSATEAAEYLAGREGNILLTTGSKELSFFGAIPRNRIYVRILPTVPAIEMAEAAGIDSRHIIAMTGPFSRTFNEFLIRAFRISWLVTKDGGAEGGFYEKAAACENCEIPMVLITRPEEEGGLLYDEVIERCK
ncbi:MAG: precorrin-6A reductase [Lachnospiraceae bacterium]|nr:precorrin-6A reductase [Lachnospiraceae bacterium]